MRTYRPSPVPQISTVTPGGYGNFCFGSQVSQAIVVKWTDRIRHELEDLGIGGAIGEEVGHD